ncbi:FAD-binding oxidoreductase [Alcaligenes faecalis]|uniref:FAD-binding oxidoreductase n=1 Tax=Alcaligenes faecalis TaxID=511 RepID=UPI001C9B8244|nr:FAD-binding oxidoreductase [Alcaligenes faecalis]MBY6310508.1 2Fe-2S iron-sulfur cluster binding domain-containing protein [Alcaligenes faecalis]MBY6318033.1 2Fe-2S iron-sulfur cluster binding domain-containing protein [Alcaligenes faecalis]MBY6392115.1 2Fe-2S iron-sulfur cluster binding domain-containing protein [Alcaligenes faecalis]
MNTTASSASTEATASRRFRDYRVLEKQRESEVITSFVLQPVDGVMPPYQPGQYLVFRLEIDGQTVLRNYSVSGDPDCTDRLRISVKHEKAPAGSSVADGLASSYLHQQVQPGDVLSAAGPMGEFVLDESSQRPVVLLSGGVGQTPLLAMLHRLLKRSQRKVYVIHACDNSTVHAFADEMRELVAQRDGVQLYFCYRNPTEDDEQAGLHHVAGLITREQLQRWLPLDDYEFYLCGPGAFMQSNYDVLRSLGVARERIHYEFFGPATVLENALAGDVAASLVQPEQPATGPAVLSSATASVSEPESLAAVDVTAADATQTVTFLPDGRQAQWHDDCPSLLDLAEETGLNPDFNCRAGLCNTCMCTLVSGEVNYFEEPLDPVPEGKVLLCCSRPRGPVAVELP